MLKQGTTHSRPAKKNREPLITPLINPAKRAKEPSRRSRTFSFSRAAIDRANELQTQARTLREKLMALTRAPGNGEDPDTVDVFTYYKEKRHSIDIDLLKAIALILGAPASQNTVKRAFSALQFLLTDKNYRLKDDYFEKLAVLRINRTWHWN